MPDQIIRGKFIGTSTVVYDFRRFPALRFRVEFTHAGEDYLFWMELAEQGARFAFSPEIEATYGSGVNLYAGSEWGSEQFALRIHNELRYRKTTLDLFQPNAEQPALLTAAMAQLRRAFVADLVRRVLHRQRLPMDLIRAQWALDPAMFAQVPLVLARKLIGKP